MSTCRTWTRAYGHIACVSVRAVIKRARIYVRLCVVMRVRMMLYYRIVSRRADSARAEGYISFSSFAAWMSGGGQWRQTQHMPPGRLAGYLPACLCKWDGGWGGTAECRPTWDSSPEDRAVSRAVSRAVLRAVSRAVLRAVSLAVLRAVLRADPCAEPRAE